MKFKSSYISRITGIPKFFPISKPVVEVNLLNVEILLLFIFLQTPLRSRRGSVKFTGQTIKFCLLRAGKKNEMGQFYWVTLKIRPLRAGKKNEMGQIYWVTSEFRPLRAPEKLEGSK